MQRVYTLAEAKARIAHWQQRLNLTEWAITVAIVRQRDLHKTWPLLGDVEILELKQMAKIRLLDPQDFQSTLGFIEQHDHELTIVHELLHIRLYGMADDAEAVRELMEERAVHALSQTLVTLDGERWRNGGDV